MKGHRDLITSRTSPMTRRLLETITLINPVIPETVWVGPIQSSSFTFDSAFNAAISPVKDIIGGSVRKQLHNILV